MQNFDLTPYTIPETWHQRAGIKTATPSGGWRNDKASDYIQSVLGISFNASTRTYLKTALCVSDCLTFCLSARISPEPHTCDLYQIFLCMLAMSVVRSSSNMLTIGRIAYWQEGGHRSAQREQSVIYDCIVFFACWLFSLFISHESSAFSFRHLLYNVAHQITAFLTTLGDLQGRSSTASQLAASHAGCCHISHSQHSWTAPQLVQ